MAIYRLTACWINTSVTIRNMLLRKLIHLSFEKWKLSRHFIAPIIIKYKEVDFFRVNVTYTKKI